MTSEIKHEQPKCKSCGKNYAARNGLCRSCYNDVYFNQHLRMVPVTSDIYQYSNFSQFKKALARWLKNNEINVFVRRDLPEHFQHESYFRRACSQGFLQKHDIIRERGDKTIVWRLQG